MRQIGNADEAANFVRGLAAEVRGFLEGQTAAFGDQEFHFKIESRWNGEGAEEGCRLWVTGAFRIPEEPSYQEFNMLDVQISFIDQQVQVKHILQPLFMKSANVVMKLLHILQQAGAQVGFALIVAGVSDAFYDLLLQMGGQSCAAQSLEGETLEDENAVFLPPSVGLLGPFHEQLADLIRRSCGELERAYAQMALECRVSCRELDDGTWVIEVNGAYRISGIEEKEPFLMLRLYIGCRNRQVDISNIFLPQFMRYRNIGKELIRRVFELAEREAAQVYLVDMVPSFYRRMCSCGARRCYCVVNGELAESGDILRITRDTRLD